MHTFVVLDLMHMLYCSNCLYIADSAFISHSSTKQLSFSTPELFQMGEVAVVLCLCACMYACVYMCVHTRQRGTSITVVYVWPCVS